MAMQEDELNRNLSAGIQQMAVTDGAEMQAKPASAIPPSLPHGGRTFTPTNYGSSMIERMNPARTVALLLLAMALASGSAFAQQNQRMEAFTQERFAALQQEGALILLDVHADWCPTCARQQQILADFHAQYPDVPLHVLRIDFDSQKRYVRQFRAPRQSTFILYRGTERVWFSVAETSPEVIFSELNKAAAAR
jgi:thioredoxin 1